jgi:hypothetical protein
MAPTMECIIDHTNVEKNIINDKGKMCGLFFSSSWENIIRYQSMRYT